MAIVDGAPAIVFYDATGQDAVYVRASDATGSSWGTPIALSTDDNVGAGCSLAVVGGYPAAAFQDVTNWNLEFVLAQDVDGAAWFAPVVAVGGLVGGNVWLGEVGGLPAVAFSDRTNDDLAYVLGTDAAGTAWNAKVLADIAGNTGSFNCGVVMSDGRPALATVELFAGEIRYLLACDALGNEWPPAS